MKSKASSASNGLHQNESAGLKMAEERKKRIRQEAAEAYAKAKANKIPGKLDWDGFMQKHRVAIEEALRAKHGGGLEPVRPT